MEPAILVRALGFITCAALAVSAAAETTLTYCSVASPMIFNPQLADDGPTQIATSKVIYDRLLDFEPGTTKVIPALAEKWTVSKDGRTYTFELRKDVQFHTTAKFKPTRAFNADDVLFSFERALKKDHAFHALNGGKYPYFESLELGQTIKTIKKTGDMTVVFNLRHAEAPFLAELAMGFAVILSQEYGHQLEKDDLARLIDIDPVGTGPFVLDRYLKDSSIRYSVHERYWRGRAKLDKLVFNIVPDAAQRAAKLKSGECQLAGELPPAGRAALALEENVKLASGPGANIGYLAFNVEKPPFNKLAVRQAVALALNREAYIQSIYGTGATLAKNPLPPSVWGYSGDTKDLPFDPARAKKLLTQAGFKNGFEAELWTLPLERPYNPNGRKMGELMQADLAKIGIRLKIVSYDWLTYLAKARKGEHQLIQSGWTSESGDPDNFLRTLLSCATIASGANLARWCNSGYDRLVEKARRVSGIEARTLLYYQAQDIFSRQLPWVPLAHATVFRGLAKNLEGYQISPSGLEDFYPLELK